jgi:hypothetical protein
VVYSEYDSAYAPKTENALAIYKCNKDTERYFTMKKLNIDYDIFTDIQTPLKNSQSDIHKEQIRKLRFHHPLLKKPVYEPSIYYPIVAEAWKRFKET